MLPTHRSIRIASIVAIGTAAVASSVSAVCDTNPWGIVIHLTPASYTGCNDVQDSELSCPEIDPIGDGGPQFAWLVAYGWSEIPGWPHEPIERGIGGAQFGIAYESTVTVLAWSLCTGGSEIPMNDPFLGISWPDSETGNAVTWAGGEYFSPSGFAKIGFLNLEAGSGGRLAIAADPRISGAGLAAADGSFFLIPPSGMSSVAVDGTSPDDACVTCGLVIPTRESSWGAIKALYGDVDSGDGRTR